MGIINSSKYANGLYTVKKLLWVKFGWSDYYRGGLIDGNFPFIQGGEQGHEAWNFLAQDDGTYYCYTPPQAKSGKPTNVDRFGWTVVCLAKKPRVKGIHIVGWYENAELTGEYNIRPSGFDAGKSAPTDEFYYTIRSSSAWLVPPESRIIPFSHDSVRQGKYSFLRGPNVDTKPRKLEVETILVDRMERLKEVAIHNPTIITAPDDDNNSIDPISSFGSAEHRKKVEIAAVETTTRELESRGYEVFSREKDNVGYDLKATRQKDGSSLYVEVKGTAGPSERFFMTANEHQFIETPEWRIAMVTDALGKPKLSIYNLLELKKLFDLSPMVWKGTRKRFD